ncbi:DMT family transporter [Terasakiella sp. A23]|uniref:DMT family transporter n=1 Tax=Terasakiella sp. FCG-A23 TaxID=3080561 RepID=UPI0029551519|nr:DMT family transporter [Terasakiella sp. A23]MDV7341160.1 DMT family transporter [Terasakiella sp. A23]
MEHSSHITRGLFVMALGIAFMSMMDGFIKHLTSQISAPQVLFFRSLFGLVPVVVIVLMQGGLRSVKTKRPFLHFARAVLGAVCFVAFTLGLRDMSLANALALCFSAPFFMVVYSKFLLGEDVGFHRISAMIVGFMGVVIVLQPDEGILSTGAPYMLIVAAAFGLSQVLARKYAASESAGSFSLWTTMGMTVFGFCLMPFFWIDMSMETLLWCFVMGVTGGIGHYFMVEAVRLAPTAVVSPMEYTALIWAALIDWMFWQHYPEQATLAGSMVIIASGIYILWRERLHQKEGIA